MWYNSPNEIGCPGAVGPRPERDRTTLEVAGMTTLSSRPPRDKFSRTSPNQVCIPCGSCNRPLYFARCRADEGKRRFCDTACREAWRPIHQRGENAAHYGDGTTTDKGRVSVLRPDHPYANQRGYVLRSHLVIEQAIGRYVLPGEEVHHLDENPSNDTSENLVLCPDHETHIRLYHSLNGRWSMKHDACVGCGGTDRPHSGKGYCDRCFGRERYRQKHGIGKERWRIG